MIRRNGILILILLLCMVPLHAQECTLGVGGRDTDLIVQVFQLDSLQQARLLQWGEELRAVNAPLEERARQLLDAHPQQSDEDLAALGHKYDEIKAEMVANAAHYDRLLLGTFNDLQYARYAELCREVLRTPLPPIRPD